MKFNFVNKRYITGFLREVLEGPKLTLGPYSEEESGFCKYNKKINEYALSAPENMAEVLIFCVASQLVDWPNIYTRFPHLINWIYAHDGVFPKDAKMVGDKMEGGFPEEFSPIILGNKAKSINLIWKDRDNLYDKLAPIMREYNALRSGEDKEKLAFQLYSKILEVRHLAIPKAGFAVQLLIGRYGCIDSVNLNVLPVPAELTEPDEKGKLRIKGIKKTPIEGSAFTQIKQSAVDLGQKYANYLNEIGKLANDNESKLLWDKWCDIVAHKINFAGSAFDVEDTENIYKGRIVSDYARNYGEKTPPAKYGFGAKGEKATGTIIGKQHANLMKGLSGIEEAKMKDLKFIILEELLNMLGEETFAGKKELDNDGDGVPKWADKDDNDSKVGSKSSKNKGGKVPPQLQKFVKSKKKEDKDELDEMSSMSAGSVEMGIGKAGKRVMEEEGDVIFEYLSESEVKKKNPPLGKVTRNPAGSNKKFHVYVKCSGRVKKISFGDPGLSIKRDSAGRRKNFRARHKCDKPEGKNRCTARYWACMTWRKSTSVSDMTKEEED